MTYRKSIQDGLYGDSKEMIEKCLNCPKVRCTNCLGCSHKKKTIVDIDLLSENEKKYQIILSERDIRFLHYYPLLKYDKEISEAMGASVSTATHIREKLMLPRMRKYSEQERRELIRPWLRPE